MNRIGESELIITKEGRIYHLNLLPDDIANNIILVGDQSRVAKVSAFFDKITFKTQSREFITHTGTFNGKQVSVISTGIGTDNIDIVVNELDALVNIDFKTRTIKKEKRQLNMVRIGTSGSLQGDIPVDTPVVSQMSAGFDGLLNFYADRDKIANTEVESKFIAHTKWNPRLANPYFVPSSDELFQKIAGENMRYGITISAPGFYGPQGRVLRLPIQDPEINDKLTAFDYNGLKITNYEMESSAIYGLSGLLGHNALTVCLIIANRLRKEYSKDYNPHMKKLIETVLQRMTD